MSEEWIQSGPVIALSSWLVWTICFLLPYNYPYFTCLIACILFWLLLYFYNKLKNLRSLLQIFESATKNENLGIYQDRFVYLKIGAFSGSSVIFVCIGKFYDSYYQTGQFAVFLPLLILLHSKYEYCCGARDSSLPKSVLTWSIFITVLSYLAFFTTRTFSVLEPTFVGGFGVCLMAIILYRVEHIADIDLKGLIYSSEVFFFIHVFAIVLFHGFPKNALSYCLSIIESVALLTSGYALYYMVKKHCALFSGFVILQSATTIRVFDAIYNVQWTYCWTFVASVLILPFLYARLYIAFKPRDMAQQIKLYILYPLPLTLFLCGLFLTKYLTIDNLSTAGLHQFNTISSRGHPIENLIVNNTQKYNRFISSQSSTYSETVAKYKAKYNINPPRGFKKWFDYAKSRGSLVIDDYDQIMSDLRPFLALKASVFRSRILTVAASSESFVNVVEVSRQRAKAIKGTEGYEWISEELINMMRSFIHDLPDDFLLLINEHDEPRVLPSYEEAEAALSNPILNGDSSHKVNKGLDRSRSFADMTKKNAESIRFNKLTHQFVWDQIRASCSISSPARNTSFGNLTDDPEEYADFCSKPHTTKFGGFVHDFRLQKNICHQPDLEMLHGFFIAPNAFSMTKKLVPIFSQSKVQGFADILYPSPWYYVGKVKHMDSKEVAWHSKQNQSYWRGTTTGGFSRASTWINQHRQRFINQVNSEGHTAILLLPEIEQKGEIYKEFLVDQRSLNHMYDCKFTKIVQCDPEDCSTQENHFETTEFTDFQDTWRYKYLVDLEGNAFSGRWLAFLESWSVPIKSALFIEWFDERLYEWVHFIPLDIRYREIGSIMGYFLGVDEIAEIKRKRDEQARTIAEAGRAWVQRAIRPEDMEIYLFRLLLEYSRLWRDDRDTQWDE